MKKFFQRIIRQPKRQLLLTLAAEVLAAVALGLFFAQGVTDAGGDGIATFRITFYSMARSFYFNAPLFIGFIAPVFTVLFTFIPNKNSKVYLAPAVVLIACGVMVACTFECYLLPFTDEYAEMVRESGTHLAAEAALASALIFACAALEVVKAVSPAPEEEAEEEAQAAPEEEAAEEAAAQEAAEAAPQEAAAQEAAEAAPQEAAAQEAAEAAPAEEGEGKSAEQEGKDGAEGAE